MIIKTKCLYPEEKETGIKTEEFELVNEQKGSLWKTWCILNDQEKERLEANPSSWLEIYNLLLSANEFYIRSLLKYY